MATRPREASVTPLGRLRVGEIEGTPSGAWAAKLFAEAGATVTCFRRPGVALDPCPDLARDLAAHLHDGKHIVDLGNDPGWDAPLRAQGVDVVIRSTWEGTMAVDGSVPSLPASVVVTIDAFGEGPYAGWKSTPFIDEAASGHLFLNGDPARQPIPAHGFQSTYAAGAFAFIAALAALLDGASRTAQRLVTVSHLDVMSSLHQLTLERCQFGGQTMRRAGNRYVGPGNPVGIYTCTDGSISICVPKGDMAVSLLQTIGRLDLLDHPEVGSIAAVLGGSSHVEEALIEWCGSRTAAEAASLLQRARVPAAPNLTPAEVLQEPHLSERQYWRRRPEAVLPGPPFRLSPHSQMGSSTACPREGWQPGADPSASGPLAGARVLDLTRVWAGPLAARILCDLGAEVIAVEAPNGRGPTRIPAALAVANGTYPDNVAKPDPWNRNGFINSFARGKRSLGLDLTTEEGRRILSVLVTVSDVLIENFSAGVLDRLGFGVENLRSANPHLVYACMPGYGTSGPLRDWVAFGNTLDGHAGMSSLTGYEGEEPWKAGIAWPDAIAGVHAASAVLVALHHRASGAWSGGGTVEVAQFEVAVATLGHELAAVQRSRGAENSGDRRSPGSVPQGVYRCAGSDRWVAISAPDDHAWQKLCSALSLPPELAELTCAERWDRRLEIDQAIAGAIGERVAEELAATLQGLGVPAARVADADDLLGDPHLLARGSLTSVEQPGVGEHIVALLPIRVDGRIWRSTGAAPRFGSDNRTLLAEHLHLDVTTLAALESAGVVVSRPR